MTNSLTPKTELVASINDMIMRAHPAGIVGSLKGMAERHDLTGILTDIHVPAVVLSGTADQLMAQDKVQTLAQMLPMGWMVEIQGAGHMLMMEEPQQVADALLQVIHKVRES